MEACAALRNMFITVVTTMSLTTVSLRFLRRRAAKRETADIESALTVASAASAFKKNALGQNLDMF